MHTLAPTLSEARPRASQDQAPDTESESEQPSFGRRVGRLAAHVGAAYVVLTALWFGLGKLLLASDSLVARDERVSEWFADRRTDRLDTWAHWGSALSDTLVKIIFTALVVGAAAWAWRRWREPLMIAVPLVLEASVFITVTWLVGRARPDVPRLQDSPVNSSFPSGHVAAATVYTAMVVVLFWHTRKVWWRALAAVGVSLVVGVVAAARLYQGMHYLSDVIAGVLLGLVSVAAVWWVIRRAPLDPASSRADR